MIKELLADIQGLLILYSPVILTYVTQIVDWIITTRKFKSLDLGFQLRPLTKKINDLEKTVHDLVKYNNDLEAQNETLKEMILEFETYYDNLKTSLEDKMNEQNKIMQEIIKENVEIRAEKSKKEDK